VRHGEGCSGVRWPGGQQEAEVDGGQLMEEEVVGDGARPGDMAAGSSWNRVLEATGDVAVVLVNSGGGGQRRQAWRQ
jgi:hypothetical protein